jgi:HlyD family secretion protein
MNKTVKWILIGLGILIVALLVVRAVSGPAGEGTKVTAEKAARRSITETVTASGKIYPEVEVPISPDISGEVTELDVQEGDSVKKGQVLAKIYADIYSSQRDEAMARVVQSQATVENSEAALGALKAQLEQDRAAYERNKSLFDQKVISKAEFETYEAKYRASQAQYEAALQNIRSLRAATQSTRSGLVMANKNLSRTTITSPMDGYITLLSVKKGQKVVGTAQMAGTEMMRVADMSSIEARVDVGENDIVKVNMGDSADIEVDAYNNRKFRGVVTQIASSANKSAGLAAAAPSSSDVTNYEVRIRIDPSSYHDLVNPARPSKFPFRPGMNASADIKTKRKDHVISVPNGAVVARIKGSDENLEEKKKERQKKSGADVDDANDANASLPADEAEEIVFVLRNDGRVERRKVTTGIQDINYIEVTSGLNEGETVITGPYEAVSKTLKSGDKVRVVPKDQLFTE